MCICVSFVVRYIGELQSEKLKQNRSLISTQPYSLPNPIITVTEHTPTPSPDYMRRQVMWFMCLLVSAFIKMIYARHSCFVCEHAHMHNVVYNTEHSVSFFSSLWINHRHKVQGSHTSGCTCCGLWRRVVSYLRLRRILTHFVHWKSTWIKNHKIPYYICISFGVLSMYIIWVFIDCPLWTDLISLYKPDVLFMYCIYKIIIIYFSFSRLILFCASCYVNDNFYVQFGGSLE